MCRHREEANPRRIVRTASGVLAAVRAVPAHLECGDRLEDVFHARCLLVVVRQRCIDTDPRGDEKDVRVGPVGSWWNIKIGEARVPIWGKSYVPDQLMLVFGDKDRVAVAESLIYAAPASVLRDRLTLQGFSSRRVRDLAIELFAEEEDIDPRDSWVGGRVHFPTPASIVDAMTTRRGQTIAAGVPPRHRAHLENFIFERWGYLKECYDDPRFALALSLIRTHSSTIVRLDLSDLLAGGYLSSDEYPHLDARTRLAESVAASGPIIVITEGSSDARWLARALEVAAPSVATYFKFLDFDTARAPGGTDRVVALTKGMVGAGVMNRIVAVLDNDAAGHAAAHQLRRLQLPDRVSVVTLPDVDYAAHYPTLGPEGMAWSDVNGRAVSIEFMFGAKVLQPSGASHPVRWHSYIDSAKAYQGRLSDQDKRIIAERINEALFPSDDSPVPAHVEDQCRRLSSMLIGAAQTPEHLPASERSTLAAWWRDADLREARVSFSP